MDPTKLGIDRTVAASWAPDQTWPGFADDVLEDEDEADIDDNRIGAESPALPSGFHEVVTDSTSSDSSWPQPVDALASVSVPASAPEPVGAVAAIAGHPLHPVLVPLPIGSFVGAFLCDVAYVRTQDPFWARGARVLTGAGVVSGLMAGSLGALDFTGRPRVRSHAAAWVHAGGNLTVLGLGVASKALRARDERRGGGRAALALSAASVAILGVTGWLGGELAFRERIGVIPR